ncbi:MAG TPA: hypothetical protein VKY85_25045 [Candidatus Angelobacter sp.]|nr:hypothetical protein [Candidatus Angelobacter sp.]
MQTELLYEESASMAEEKIDLNMLSRVDSDLKAITFRVNDFEKDLRSLGREVSELKGSIKAAETPWWIRYIVAPLSVIAIAATTGAVIHLEIVVAGIGKNLNGIQVALSKETLTNYSQLPPSAFEDSLPEVSKTIDLARKNKVKVPEKVVDDLSKQLNATSHNASGYWPAAAELITYRSSIRHEDIEKLKTSLPKCVDSEPHPARLAQSISPSPEEQTVNVSPAYYENCQFELDNPEQDAKMNEFIQKFPFLTLRHSLVVYRGGNVQLKLGLPPKILRFEDCLWEFSVYGTPPPSGQKIAETLIASNPDSFKMPNL